MSKMRLISLYLLLIFSIYSCNFIEINKQTIDDLIPDNTSLIIRIDNPSKFKSDLINNAVSLKLLANQTDYKFNEQIKIVEKFSDKNPILICLSDEKNNKSYTIITKQSNEPIDFSNDEIHKKIIDSIYVISNSKIIVESSKLNINPLYEKYKNLKSDDATFSIFAKNSFSNNFFISVFGKSVQNINSDIFLKANLFNDKILINGVSVIDDSISKSNNIFKNSIPKENKINRAIPNSYKNFYSFKIDDDEIEEIGIIGIDNEQIAVFRSSDINKTKIKFKDYKTYDNYKGKDILEIPEKERFKKLIDSINMKIEFEKIVVIDEYIILSNSAKSIKTLIDNYLLKNTYLYSQNYAKSNEHLSKESSYEINSKNNSLIDISKLIGLKSSMNEFNNTRIQIVNENQIFHINGIIDNDNNEYSENNINKIFSTKIQGNVIIEPKFVTNHITNAKEIIVQDNNYDLYSITNQGKVLWKKKLNGKILGEVKQVDLYKNGRLQLIFATEKRLYVIDRNGRDVNPFPKIFRDKITQPLSVFDYDNNKNYRFLITQGNELLMYDSKGKIVKGFKYDASDEILYPPKHFRIKNKDIISVMTKKGLKILNRKGKIRIRIKDNVKFSNNDVYRYNNNLIGISIDGNLTQINMNGSTSNRKLDLSKNHKINAKYNLVAITNENKLSNLKKSIELPFGDFSTPKIFSYNKRKYISIFDNQGKAIYLFDDKLNLFEGFPLYSNSNIDLANIDKDNNLEIILIEEEKSIRAYEINN